MTTNEGSQKRYPAEMKERAVRMVGELRRQDPRDNSVISRVARELGVGKETLRTWVRQIEVDSGHRPGVTTKEQAEITELKRENRELKRANEILQAAASFFGAELDRRSKK